MTSENITPEQLKGAMRAWITGVAIVTGFHSNRVHGMTANSFNSIALDPPTVLVALRRQTRTQKLVREGGVFAVSVLCTEQLDLALRFAGQADPVNSRFEDVEIFSMVTGAPLIKGAIAFFDCMVVDNFIVGGTSVFIGEVLAAENLRGDQDPLLYFNREWRKLAT